jgi:hypothetical protein
VVLCVQPSGRAAYRAHEADGGTSIISVSQKLHGLETHTSAELVRESARELAPLMASMGGERAPGLAGYRSKIVDGNCREAREHRRKELRAAPGRACPGTSLVVDEPAQGLITDVFPGEDGHAQERALLGSVLASVQRNDRWIADRHCCPRAFLTEIDARGGFFVIRAHQGLPWEMVSPLRACGRTPTGQRAQPCVGVVDAQGPQPLFRRLPITLDHATSDGDLCRAILTNLPEQVSAHHVAQREQNRWKLATAFQHWEADLHAEINTLGYPKAALFGFCLALVASNVLAVVFAAWRGGHGEDTVDHKVSLYSIATEISATYKGMMMAIPEPAWEILYAMNTADLAASLLDLARRVSLQACCKSSRTPKKPRPQGKKAPTKGHVSTAQLLMNRQAHSATP